ncbi:MAG: nucleotide sugar dehydrogenase [Woeseia sp.]|jgi:GDP-mannose 6-dehydrogenase|nr:nucleotide sugar dehydrogenase [Woeseia sp.]
MNISVFGLGYVGAVTSACLAVNGHKIIGVDPNRTKTDLVNSGQAPIIEKDVTDMIRKAVSAGNLSATDDSAAAVRDSEMSLICVGTPSQSNGDLDLQYIERVCEEIGNAIGEKDTYHVVVVRSTMLPGSTRSIVIPTLERASGKTAGESFGVCVNPEFLREGSAVYDYFNPPKTVIGESDKKSGEPLIEIYSDLDAQLFRSTIEVAEMTKYVDNSWHAAKVAFGNEIGAICKAVGVDSHEVMNIFMQDIKLNISPAYLLPGFAFGGSCLPKDLRAINYKAKSLDLDVPLLRSVLPSNRVHIDRAIEMVKSAGRKKLGILGLSFKAGTDDLRESPIVEITERLLGKGYDIQIYDENVELARLTGTNRDFLMNHIPHISNLLVADIDQVINHGETIIIGNSAAEFSAAIEGLATDKHVVDLVRISGSIPRERGYDGIAW